MGQNDGQPMVENLRDAVYPTSDIGQVSTSESNSLTEDLKTKDSFEEEEASNQVPQSSGDTSQTKVPKHPTLYVKPSSIPSQQSHVLPTYLGEHRPVLYPQTVHHPIYPPQIDIHGMAIPPTYSFNATNTSSWTMHPYTFHPSIYPYVSFPAMSSLGCPSGPVPQGPHPMVPLQVFSAYPPAYPSNEYPSQYPIIPQPVAAIPYKADPHRLHSHVHRIQHRNVLRKMNPQTCGRSYFHYGPSIKSNDVFQSDSGTSSRSKRRRRTAKLEDLKYAHRLAETGPHHRVRVFKNDRNMSFYDCECGRRKPSQDLKKTKHHAEMHDVREWRCELCSRGFQSFRQLNGHLRIHNLANDE